MKIKNKIGAVVVFTFLMLIAISENNLVEARMINKDNILNSVLYRSASNVGFAINNNNSINRILKPISKNDKNSLYYFTNGVEDINNIKNFELYNNLKNNLGDVWTDYQKYKNIDKNNSFLNTNKYNQLLWIIDNMYTEISYNNSEENVNEYINLLNSKYNAGINNYNSKTEKFNLLNQDDIDIVQQLAIWHYTATGTKNDIGDPRRNDYKMADLLITSDKLSGKYKRMYDDKTLQEKLVAMSKLYTCFILNASENYNSMNLTKLKNGENKLINLETYDTTTINTVRSNENYSYVSGPYKITDNNLGVEYKISSFNCNAEFTEGENLDITSEVDILIRKENGRYVGITDSEGNLITNNNEILEELKNRNQEFYLAISSNITKVKKINLNISSQYVAREVFYYSLKNPGEYDSPILKVEDVQEFQQCTASAILELTTEMDFSLRQFITAINDKELKDADGNYIREPKVDISYLNKKINGNRITTANYNHTKDTIKVEIGDVITYTIRVYNEGGVNGYVSEITNYLPAYLEYINNEENSSNGWVLQDSSDLRIIKTRKLAAISGDDTGNINQRLIKSFDGNNLCYRDIKLKCRVIDPNTTDNLSSALSDIETKVENTETQEETNETYEEDDGGTGGIAYIIQYAKDIINGNKNNNENNNQNNENTNIENNEINNNITDNTSANNNQNNENAQEVPNEENQKAETVIITNLSEITEIEDEFGNNQNVKDRDSATGNLSIPTDEELPKYKNQELSKNEPYVPGEQDDDDFEKVQLKNFDLSLRQFISKINDTEITSRIPNVDISNLNNGTSTTANYNHSKEYLKAEIGDTVTFTIRVYNEGEIDGYCEEITQHIPDQLEFIAGNDINKQFEWEQSNDRKIVKTKYLAKSNDEKGSGDNKRENKIVASDGNDLKYKEVKIALKVVRTESMLKKITTFSEITNFVDYNGENIKDRDSIKGNLQEPENWSIYKDEQIRNSYIAGQEDDDDFEKIIIGEFDLALKEFISKVNDTEINTRAPQVDSTNLINMSSTNATYNYSKDIITVNAGDIIEFTIRIYNEGDVAGFASQLIDEIPNGLEFVVDNEINKKYNWKMYDINGNDTDNNEEAKYAATDYLSKRAGEERMNNDSKLTKNPSLISSYEILSNTNPSYVEAKIALKIKSKGITEEVIENKVQISKIENENGNETVDRDSVANDWKENEDDQDSDKLNVRYFNLTVNSKLAETIMIGNGVSKTIKNNQNINNSDDVVLSINKKDINSINVKFKYNITIKNEGTIPGYVNEIKDYIPEGLEFNENDNLLWKKIDEKIISTDQTKNVLIEPGKSLNTEVVLSWIGSINNIGSYKNYVEISKDYNEFNAKDIDSIPDNGINEENDLGKTNIKIEIKKNNIILYVIIGIGSLAFIIIAVVIIKKFILHN